MWIIIAGLVLFFTGIVLMVLSKIGLGIAIFFIGFIAIAFGAAKMMRTGGYSDGIPFFNGLKGQGRQQSEVEKVPQYENGEQPANIWDQMTQEDK